MITPISTDANVSNLKVGIVTYAQMTRRGINIVKQLLEYSEEQLKEFGFTVRSINDCLYDAGLSLRINNQLGRNVKKIQELLNNGSINLTDIELYLDSIDKVIVCKQTYNGLIDSYAKNNPN